MRKTYTVIGLYPSALTDFPHPRDGSWVTDVTAESPKAAAQQAMQELCSEQVEYEPDDLAVIAVFEGAHADVWEGP